MKTIELADAASGERAIREGQTEDVLVTRDGRPVALVAPFDEDESAWYARENDPQFIQSIARAREQVKSGRTVSHEQLNAELGT